ncbi:hypothetical protein GOV10_06685, partial [Candidatus Woesearchaeota archaeon]|nr:hypothetical protein [Candidatus Woesearchaeota archaeon]
KNRARFYKFLKDAKILNTLANKKLANKATTNKTVKRTVKKTAAKKVLLVGAKDGQKVHKPTCLIAQRIPKGKRVTFKSKHEALVKGYGPCKICQSFD